MVACSAIESETAFNGFKFTKKPRMRVIAPTIFSFSISLDFYHYMDADHHDDDDDDDDYISNGDDDYSGSDVNMIGVVDSDTDDHQVITATPCLHVPELPLPHQFDDHDDVDDEKFYSAQTYFISSPSISTGSYSSDPTYTSPSSSSSSSPGYTPSSPDNYSPSSTLHTPSSPYHHYTPSSPDHYTPSLPYRYTPSPPDHYSPSSPAYAPS